MENSMIFYDIPNTGRENCNLRGVKADQKGAVLHMCQHSESLELRYPPLDADDAGAYWSAPRVEGRA
jgi:hypothetical protein